MTLNLQEIRRADTYLSAAAAALQGEQAPEAKQFVEAVMNYNFAGAQQILETYPHLGDTVARISMIDRPHLMQTVQKGAQAWHAADNAVGPEPTPNLLTAVGGHAIGGGRVVPSRQALLWGAIERAAKLPALQEIDPDMQRNVLRSEMWTGLNVAIARKLEVDPSVLEITDEDDRQAVRREQEEALRLSQLVQENRPTTLFEAAFALDFERYDQLIRAGANPAVTNARGETPLDVARRVAGTRGNSLAFEQATARMPEEQVRREREQQRGMVQ